MSLTTLPEEVRYAGFWVRTIATIIDNIVMMPLVFPLLYWMMSEPGESGEVLVNTLMRIMINPDGDDALLLNVVPAVVGLFFAMLFWTWRNATPGKMLFSAIIVDAKTLGTPSTGQYVGRYFAYLVSALPLMLGFLWIVWDSRKQGWHDKLAGTVVIYRDR